MSTNKIWEPLMTDDNNWEWRKFSTAPTVDVARNEGKMLQDHMTLVFDRMTEPELRAWLDANPHSVNARNMDGETCLFRAVNHWKSASLVMWLVERGVNVNTADMCGYTAIQYARSTEILDALLLSGADPTIRTEKGFTLLMAEVRSRRYVLATHLLKDSRIRTLINAQDQFGNSALHFVCHDLDDPAVHPLILLFLKYGASLMLEDARGETPMRLLQRLYPTNPLTITLADEILTVEKTDALVMTVRKVMATKSPVATCLQHRVECGRPLPIVEMAQQSCLNDEKRLRVGVALLSGVGRKGLPRDMFWAVLDMIMPAWDPLRRCMSPQKKRVTMKRGGAEKPMVG
ncbi:hypothetical protein VYU27_004916 [Nannochloropsis oceanica]